MVQSSDKTYVKHRLQYVYSILLLVGLIVYSASALAINGRTTYQAKIYKPDGQPLEAVSVNFRFTVLDPSSSCVLFIEDYAAVNMIGSGGLTSFSLGMGTRTYPASGPTTFATVFDNSIPSFVCQTPGVYNPIPTDNRKVVMQFNEGSGWQTLPAMPINSVPYAMYSAKAQNSTLLNGKADSEFVEVSTLAGLNCQVNEAIQFNGATFSCIAVGVASSGISSVTTSGTVLSTGGTASAPVISITAATMSSDGYLTSLDYAEFKAKLSASSTEIISTLGYAPVSGSAVNTQIQAANLAGDVSGTIAANFVQSVGGKTSAQVATSVDDTLAATSSSTADTIVKRNASGNFTANDVYANATKLNYVDIYRPSTSFNIRLQAPTSLAANYTLNLPTSSGTVGQVLSTDGSGNLSWISAATGSVTSVSATAPLVSTGGSTPTISITQSTSSTDGYLSSADWNTFNNKQQATQAAIIATLGYTPANATSATQWTTNGANISYSTGNVGVGTSAPTERLTVGAGKLAIINTAAWDHLSFYHSGANAYYDVGGAENGLIIRVDGSGGAGYPAVSYTEVMRLMPSGNVGIGTTNPAFLLDVSGSARTGSVSNGSVVIGNDGNAFIEMRENDSAGTPYIDFVNDPSTDFDFRIILNGDDSFSLLGGSVGIGTQTPTALLNLAAGSVSNAPLKFTSGTLLSAPQSGTMEYDGNQYYLTDGANIRRTIATGSVAGSIDNASNINSSGNITLTPTGSVIVSSTTASTDSSTGALIVKGGLGVAGDANFGSDISVAGRVGVGTVTPQTALDVSGVIRAGSNSSVQGSDLIYARYTAGSETTGTLGARYSSGGLFLGYGIKAGPGPTAADYYQSSYAANLGRSVVQLGDDVDFLTAPNQTTAIGSSVAMTSRFYISNAGNVGVATSAPRQKFDVAPGSGDAVMRATTVDGSAAIQLYKRTGGAYQGHAITTQGNALHFNYDAAENTGSVLMTLSASGNLGVGVAATEKFDVLGNMRVGGSDSNYIAFRGTTGDGTGSYNHTYIGERQYGGIEASELLLFKGNDSDNASGPDRIRMAAGNIVFDTYASPDAPSGTFEAVASSPMISTKMIIKGDGKVGIGTTAPVTRLDIRGPNGSPSSYASGTLAINTGGVAALLFGTDDTTASAEYAWIQSHGTRPLHINKVGNNTVLNANAGNVGIGTAAPTTKLEVAGGDINVPTGRVSFNAGTTAGTSGIASSDAGAIFGEHDLVSEVSRLVIEIYDNVNDQIVMRTNAPSGGTNVDMVKVQHNIVSLAPTTGNVGVGVATPTSKLHVNGGIKQNNLGSIWVSWDGVTRVTSMPAFLNDAYMNTHQDEVFTWRAPAPSLKDTVGCGAGPSAGYMFSNGGDSTWGGTYRLVIGKAGATNIVDIQYAGWGVQLLDASFGTITGISNGNVNATMTFSGGVWTVEHMAGQVETTPFSCH